MCYWGFNDLLPVMIFTSGYLCPVPGLTHPVFVAEASSLVNNFLGKRHQPITR
jgi:hypothetical protein